MAVYFIQGSVQNIYTYSLQNSKPLEGKNSFFSLAGANPDVSKAINHMNFLLSRPQQKQMPLLSWNPKNRGLGTLIMCTSPLPLPHHFPSVFTDRPETCGRRGQGCTLAKMKRQTCCGRLGISVTSSRSWKNSCCLHKSTFF